MVTIEVEGFHKWLLLYMLTLYRKWRNFFTNFFCFTINIIYIRKGKIFEILTKLTCYCVPNITALVFQDIQLNKLEVDFNSKFNISTSYFTPPNNTIFSCFIYSEYKSIAINHLYIFSITKQCYVTSAIKC